MPWALFTAHNIFKTALRFFQLITILEIIVKTFSLDSFHKKKNSSSLVFQFMAMCLACLVVSPSLKAKPVHDPMSFHSILSFTRFLINKGEYYRANVEIDRMLSYFPGNDFEDKLRLTQIYVLYGGGQFNDVLGYKNDNVFLDRPTMAGAKIFKIDSMFKLNLKAGQDFLNYSGDNSFLFSAFKRREIMNEFFNFKVKDSIDNKEYWERYPGILQHREEYASDTLSPPLAALLGIFPGGGYWYSGRGGTGTVAFVTIALGSFMTYGFHEEGSPLMSVLSGLITTLFYGGSILGGYLEAEKKNDSLKRKYFHILDRELGLESDREKIFVKFGIGL